jgi:hypothetical protein
VLEPNTSILYVVNGVPVRIGCEQRGGENWIVICAKTPTYEATVIGLDAELAFRENPR